MSAVEQLGLSARLPRKKPLDEVDEVPSVQVERPLSSSMRVKRSEPKSMVWEGGQKGDAEVVSPRSPGGAAKSSSSNKSNTVAVSRLDASTSTLITQIQTLVQDTIASHFAEVREVLACERADARGRGTAHGSPRRSSAGSPRRSSQGSPRRSSPRHSSSPRQSSPIGTPDRKRDRRSLVIDSSAALDETLRRVEASLTMSLGVALESATRVQQEGRQVESELRTKRARLSIVESSLRAAEAAGNGAGVTVPSVRDDQGRLRGGSAGSLGMSMRRKPESPRGGGSGGGPPKALRVPRDAGEASRAGFGYTLGDVPSINTDAARGLGKEGAAFGSGGASRVSAAERISRARQVILERREASFQPPVRPTRSYSKPPDLSTITEEADADADDGQRLHSRGNSGRGRHKRSSSDSTGADSDSSTSNAGEWQAVAETPEVDPMLAMLQQRAEAKVAELTSSGRMLLRPTSPSFSPRLIMSTGMGPGAGIVIGGGDGSRSTSPSPGSPSASWDSPRGLARARAARVGGGPSTSAPVSPMQRNNMLRTFSESSLPSFNRGSAAFGDLKSIEETDDDEGDAPGAAVPLTARPSTSAVEETLANQRSLSGPRRKRKGKESHESPPLDLASYQRRDRTVTG